MQSCIAESCRFLQGFPVTSIYTVHLPRKKQQKAEDQPCRNNKRGRATAKIKEEDDTLLWESISAETPSSQASDSRKTAGVVEAPENGLWSKPEAEQDLLPARDGDWEQSLSREEQVRMDEEAREFAYSFGANEARDVTGGAIITNEEEAEQQEAQAGVEGSSGGKGKKGRRRNERRGGRPKDSSIPLHMLPKVCLISLIFPHILSDHPIRASFFWPEQLRSPAMAFQHLIIIWVLRVSVPCQPQSLVGALPSLFGIDSKELPANLLAS